MAKVGKLPFLHAMMTGNSLGMRLLKRSPVLLPFKYKPTVTIYNINFWNA